MRLLVIDTCGTDASVVLAEDWRVVAKEALPGRSASERLITVVRQLLEGAGWTLGELTAIGVVHGPGSFTGVRVGVSAAKGLSAASGVKLVAISRLELFQRVSGDDVAALHAGRGEFYVREGGTESVRSLPEGALLFEEGTAMPGAAEAVEMVAERVQAGRFEEAATLDANYVRRSEGLYGRAAV